MHLYVLELKQKNPDTVVHPHHLIVSMYLLDFDGMVLTVQMVTRNSGLTVLTPRKLFRKKLINGAWKTCSLGFDIFSITVVNKQKINLLFKIHRKDT